MRAPSDDLYRIFFWPPSRAPPATIYIVDSFGPRDVLSILLAPIAHAPRDNSSQILWAVPSRRFVADILWPSRQFVDSFGPDCARPSRRFVADSFGCAMRRPAANSLAAPSKAPRGDSSQIRSAVPSRIPRSLPFLWPMHFSPSSRYRHLLHTVSSSSVRRSGTISSKHRADGRS